MTLDLLRLLNESKGHMLSRRHLRLSGISETMIAAAVTQETVVVLSPGPFGSVILTGDGISMLAESTAGATTRAPNDRERLVEAARKPMPHPDLIRNWLAWVTVDGYRTDGERVDAGTLLDMIDASPATAVPAPIVEPAAEATESKVADDIHVMTVSGLRTALEGLPDDAPVHIESYVPGGGEDGKHGGLLVHVEGWVNEITGVSAVLWSAEAA